MLVFDFDIPTKIVFGSGKIDELKKAKLPGKMAMVVIERDSVLKENGTLNKVLDSLKRQEIEYLIYDKIAQNPTKSMIMEASQIARDNFCNFVLGVGGGSVIDASKAIALMTRNPGDLWDYMMTGSGKGLPLKNRALPVIAVPTTAGAGSEANPWIVITNEETHEKIAFGKTSTFPMISFVDPDLTKSVPPFLTAIQGLDSFYRAVQGYIAKKATPVSDVFALKTISLIANNLRGTVEDSANSDLRANISLASMLSGFVSSLSGVTSLCAMADAMCAYHPELPHGAAQVMLAVPYFTFFAKVVPEKLCAMCDAMGVPSESDPMRFVETIARLHEKCNLKGLKMTEYGIKADDMELLARNAYRTMSNLFAMDRYPLSLKETVGIFEKAFM